MREVIGHAGGHAFEHAVTVFIGRRGPEAVSRVEAGRWDGFGRGAAGGRVGLRDRGG